MVKEYRIYIIKTFYDTDIGADVQRWMLAGKYAHRRHALYKARSIALKDRYSRVEVVYRTEDKNKKISSKVLWSHQKGQSVLPLRLRHHTSLIRRMRDKRKKQAQ